MESSEKWLSGEYLVGVNGSGDWWTASCEQHERLRPLVWKWGAQRRAKNCEGQKALDKEERRGGQSPDSGNRKIHHYWFTVQVEATVCAALCRRWLCVWVLRWLPEHLEACRQEFNANCYYVIPRLYPKLQKKKKGTDTQATQKDGTPSLKAQHLPLSKKPG